MVIRKTLSAMSCFVPIAVSVEAKLLNEALLTTVKAHATMTHHTHPPTATDCSSVKPIHTQRQLLHSRKSKLGEM